MAKTATKATTKKARKAPAKKAAPKAPKAPSALKTLQAAYPHVLSIATSNEKDKPLRVVVGCSDEYGLDDCAKTREIATQDAFQVSRCSPCQREFAKRRRRKTPAAA